MSNDSNPNKPTKPRSNRQKTDTPKKPTSQAKIESNRKNARHSTGPTSPAGKVKSSKNSYKHGFRANFVNIKDEDPQLYAVRFNAWRPSLNPLGDDFSDYLLSATVHKSLAWDRIRASQTARAADLARDALKVRADARFDQIHEDLKHLESTEEAPAAARRLKSTPEGCEVLIKEWDHLRAALIDPPHWDKSDTRRLYALLGHGGYLRGKAPGALYMACEWIMNHREVKTRLDANLWPDAVTWKERYHTKTEHQIDKDRIGSLAAGSQSGVDWLLETIGNEQKNLRELIEWHHQDEAASRAEASLRAQVDTSDEGRLLHRYEMDHERSMFKYARELEARTKALVSHPEVVSAEGVEADDSEAISEEAGAPNEAKRQVRIDRELSMASFESQEIVGLEVVGAGPMRVSDRE